MKYLLVGGHHHATHRDVNYYPPDSAHTLVTAPPLSASFWNNQDPMATIEPVLYYKRRFVLAPTGRRIEIYQSGNPGMEEVLDAIRRVGLPGVISVLLPSRGRSHGPLQESVHSLWAAAADSTRVEVLVAADDDDGATLEACETLGVHCIQTKRYGYSRLNEYFNRLADLATGEWLMLWNDDARMETIAWDEVLFRTPTDILVADPWVDGHSPHLCTFPILRRWALDKVGGCYSPLTCHCDTWWQDIGRQLDVIQPVEIRVDHQRSDLTGGHNDQTRAEALAGYRQAEFYGPEVQAGIKDYVEKIGRAMQEERYR